MDDFFGRMVAIFVLVIAIVFLPICALAIKQENTTRSMIETYVTEFVDNARTTGKITAEEYEKCYRNVLMCQDFCSLSITHSSRMYSSSADGSVAYYADFVTKDILDAIYNNGDEIHDYELRNGDYLTVLVKNEKPTFATKLFRLFNKRKTTDVSIYVNYGGLVGNYIED